jgi:hypothetical protein
MSWCDKLGSTPTVGFQMSPHFANSAILLDAFSPILDRHTELERMAAFNLEEVADNFAIAFNTYDGYKYGADATKLSVGFNHRMRTHNVSGGTQRMEQLTETAPFTELLPRTFEKASEAALLLPNAAKRTIDRVGVVSHTAASEDVVPPGVAKLLQWMGKPWGKLAPGFHLQFSGELEAKGDWSDRCTHTLVRREHGHDDLLTLIFDFQRTYKTPKAIHAEKMADIFHETQKSALRYFEELAEGDRFDAINDNSISPVE